MAGYELTDSEQIKQCDLNKKPTRKEIQKKMKRKKAQTIGIN